MAAATILNFLATLNELAVDRRKFRPMKYYRNINSRYLAK